MNKQEIIDKVILGKLEPEEQKLFDQWVNEDPKFKEDLDFYRNLAAVTKEREKDVLKQQLQKQESKISNKGKNTLRRVLLVVLGIILLAVAVIGYQLEKEKKSPAGIYASHYEVAPNIYHPVTRGNSDSLTQAFMAYENGNYPEAVEKFSELIKVDRSIELKFYQAMAYAEIENYPLALKNLENIKRFQSDYLDDSYWYLGLFYLKTGKQPSAIRHFQDFIELTEDSEKKAGAIAILTILLDL